MKPKRHDTILELVQSKVIRNQNELTVALAEAGFDVAQSTISRDIRELGLIIERTVHGIKYTAPSQSNLNKMIYDSITKVMYAGNMLVLRTKSGMAMAVALALDEMGYEEVLGSIAGDDTVFCVVRSEAEAALMVERLTM